VAVTENLTILSDYHSIRRAAGWLRSHIDQHVCVEAAEDFELAMVECLNNIVRHAYREKPGQPIFLTIELHEDTLMLRITDAGDGYSDHSTKHEVTPLDESGRGLALIACCVDLAMFEQLDDHNVTLLSISVDRGRR
jgi:anti-sigma regulatory factor (Ser/Thr protein kinase)